ncbi:hypothetical protein HDV01_000920 [Terramyces sp. JEL0728]|nr:hypothetical protein HDV01_000920 [Terramyces sp. JEL0728]
MTRTVNTENSLNGQENKLKMDSDEKIPAIVDYTPSPTSGSSSTNQNSFACTHCRKPFATIADRNMHILRQHSQKDPDEVFECTLCTNKYNFKEYMRHVCANEDDETSKSSLKSTRNNRVEKVTDQRSSKQNLDWNTSVKSSRQIAPDPKIVSNSPLETRTPISVELEEFVSNQMNIIMSKPKISCPSCSKIYDYQDFITHDCQVGDSQTPQDIVDAGKRDTFKRAIKDALNSTPKRSRVAKEPPSNSIQDTSPDIASEPSTVLLDSADTNSIGTVELDDSVELQLDDAASLSHDNDLQVHTVRIVDDSLLNFEKIIAEKILETPIMDRIERAAYSQKASLPIQKNISHLGVSGTGNGIPLDPPGTHRSDCTFSDNCKASFQKHGLISQKLTGYQRPILDFPRSANTINGCQEPRLTENDSVPTRQPEGDRDSQPNNSLNQTLLAAIQSNVPLSANNSINPRVQYFPAAAILPNPVGNSASHFQTAAKLHIPPVNPNRERVHVPSGNGNATMPFNPSSISSQEKVYDPSLIPVLPKFIVENPRPPPNSPNLELQATATPKRTTHNGAKCFPCYDCKEVFDTRETLKVEKKDSFSCPRCKKTYNTGRLLQTHARACPKVVPTIYPCV